MENYRITQSETADRIWKIAQIDFYVSIVLGIILVVSPFLFFDKMSSAGMTIGFLIAGVIIAGQGVLISNILKGFAIIVERNHRVLIALDEREGRS